MRSTRADEPGWVVGIDVGGTGSRLRACEPAGGREVTLSGRAVVVGPAGSDVADVVRDLVGALLGAAPAGMRAAAAVVGATGLATLVRDPQELHTVLGDGLASVGRTEDEASRPRTGVAADVLTAHLGALGGRGGAVVAAGTGAIGFGTDLRDVWHRTDGWGHLLGDLGSGSWIGAHGLRAAIAAHDHRHDGGSVRLLEAATERLGPVPTWPDQLYTRGDRASVLASFVPAVVAASDAGDAVARRVLASAGEHLATTLAAALVDGVPRRAAATGGLLAAGPALTDAFHDRFAELCPDVVLEPSAGSPLDGALALAQRLAAGDGTVGQERPWLTIGGDGPRQASLPEKPTEVRG